jgi:hypothetical protein
VWAQPFAHPNLEFAGGAPSRTDDPTDFTAAHPGHVPVTVDPAEVAYEAVLAGAGAFPRDTVTVRTVQEVRDRTGGWGPEEPADLLDGLDPAEAPEDEDGDGMADVWERDHGLDPADPEDHREVMASGYTAVEEYVNGLADQLVGAAPAAAGTDAPDPAATPTSRAAGPEIHAAPGEPAGVPGPGAGSARSAVVALVVAGVALGVAVCGVAVALRARRP